MGASRGSGGEVGGSPIQRQASTTWWERKWWNQARNRCSDSLAAYMSKVWIHFEFYSNDDGRKLEKDFAIWKNCLTKVRYSRNTTNMLSHLQRHHSEPVSQKSVCYPASWSDQCGCFTPRKIPLQSSQGTGNHIWLICVYLQGSPAV